jgi:hypothetical protein
MPAVQAAGSVFRGMEIFRAGVHRTKNLKVLSLGDHLLAIYK